MSMASTMANEDRLFNPTKFEQKNRALSTNKKVKLKV